MICNVITPDNFDKKFLELRSHLFGDLRLRQESGFKPEVDTLNDSMLNQDNLNLIVERIFNKAQNEHEYCNFYGQLCEEFIRLELNLRGMDAKRNTMKYSTFRKTLLAQCKLSFDQFFLME